jgi:hypothetical protein
MTENCVISCQRVSFTKTEKQQYASLEIRVITQSMGLSVRFPRFVGGIIKMLITPFI